ncbi:MAG: bacillithiol biosynthesis deacetylase BshB1 [Actinobacteria bacterium]|nr:bacillithiol biosynthesis deacetylase BshB1 [Actinomycetota bacterium]
MEINVIAFSPHPDDAEMGCGGLLLKLKDTGYTTGIIDLTEAELSTNGDLNTRRKETREASGILKLDLRLNLDLGDCRIKNDPDSRIKIIDVLREFRPVLTVIPYRTDRHPDHENSYKLLKDAFFISGLEKFDTGKKPYRPAAVISYMLNNQFKPSFIVDISKYYRAKMEACKSYKSQFYSTGMEQKATFINSKYFREMITSRDKCYGLKIRADYGEPYYIEDDIKIEDPVKFFSYLL